MDSNSRWRFILHFAFLVDRCVYPFAGSHGGNTCKLGLYCIKLFSGNFFHWANENVTKNHLGMHFIQPYTTFCGYAEKRADF